jgi:hypothetical protein
MDGFYFCTRGLGTPNVVGKQLAEGYVLSLAGKMMTMVMPGIHASSVSVRLILIPDEHAIAILQHDGG